jgi:hypothetical protein
VSILSIPTVAPRHRDGQALAESLKSNRNLKCLLLDWNNIGDRGAEAGGECLPTGVGGGATVWVSALCWRCGKKDDLWRQCEYEEVNL